MVEFGPEIELETRGVALSGLDFETGQMHGPFETVGFSRWIDVESFSPNCVSFPGQRNHQGSEKLAACGHPFRGVDTLGVVRTRGMLSYSQKAPAFGEPTDIDFLGATTGQPHQL